MTRERWTLLASCATLALGGCGARSPLADLESGSASIPDAGGSGTVSCVDQFPRTSDADWPSGLACDPDAPPGLFGMFAIDGFDVVGVASDGTRIVHRLLGDRDTAGLFAGVPRIAVRGDFVAVSVEAAPGPYGNGYDNERETAILARSGALLARSVDLHGTTLGIGTRLFMSDRGLVAYGWTVLDAVMPYQTGVRVLAPDGNVMIDVRGYEPIAEPSPSGSVLVWGGGDDYSFDDTTWWLDVCSGELRPTKQSGDTANWDFSVWGPNIVFPGGPERSALVIEGPETATAIEMPEAAGDLLEIHPAGQALLGTDTPGRVIVADLNTLRARAIDIQLPAGLTPLTHLHDTSAYGCRVASNGTLYLPMRSDSLGRLYTTDDGHDWHPVPGLKPIGNVSTAWAREAAGSYFLYGEVGAADIPWWSPAPEGTTRLDDNTVQIARPDASSGVVVLDHPSGIRSPDGLLRLSHDGGCVSNRIDGGIEVWNALSGARLEIAFADPSAHYPMGVSSFVPGEDVLSLSPGW